MVFDGGIYEHSAFNFTVILVNNTIVVVWVLKLIVVDPGSATNAYPKQPLNYQYCWFEQRHCKAFLWGCDILFPSIVPNTSDFSKPKFEITTRVKALSVFKKADRWVANIFKANLLLYIQHSLAIALPKNSKTNRDCLTNHVQHNYCLRSNNIIQWSLTWMMIYVSFCFPSSVSRYEV